MSNTFFQGGEKFSRVLPGYGPANHNSKDSLKDIENGSMLRQASEV